MSAFFRAIGNFLRQLRWWVIVEPWELVLRVRLGKRMRVLTPGLHWRVPFADAVYRQSVRRRVACLARQTVSTRDGKVVTLAGILSYCIADIATLYNTLQHAEGSILNLAASEVAAVVARHTADDLMPGPLGTEVTAALDFAQFGLAEAEVCFTDFAFVRTYRLITDSNPNYTYGDALTTTVSEQAAAENAK